MPYKDPAKAREHQKSYRKSHKRVDKPTAKQREDFFARHGGQHNYNRDMQLRRNYGITLDEFNALAAQQNFACVICGHMPSRNPEAKWNQKVLHVDHDHKTGKIRGLLCSDCNRGIGFMREDPELLQRAADYVTDRG